MTSVNKKRNARKNQEPTSNMTIETEDGTQADRPKKRPAKKRSKVVRRAAQYGDVNEPILRDFVKATIQTGVKQLSTEFLNLKMETQPCNKPKTGHEGHPEKNRYKDVYCIDDTRVVLKWPEDSPSDYIHANWVKINGANKFICTQGPTEKTVDDFYRLIWQEKAPCVVMLCNIMECGKKKCEQYWPETADGQMILMDGKLTVKIAEPAKEVEQNILLMKITVIDDKGTSHNFEHWQWKAWPDRGVPELPMAVFRLLIRLKTASPIVVHCSAGIGRTGSIVGLEIALVKFCAGEKVVLKDIVKEIRNQRHGSVQTDAQYLFMHRVLLALAENRKITSPELSAFVAEYDKVIATKNG
ncbi:Protein-tyrosine phosphatase [Caenorhabditis elegans]|uniref:Protein-tyrosine phosphatase n=1 Tax=Caenorhabditis elegans TaxID=6239 RepID=P91498_CAEEL|nr:Protein-tyrosine phosphatase [Caenorhabditis elegans]CCD72005.1 Protein-tyrosine phosphatase [Caenorhabditis elegans]|eukprot:NP_491761.3 Tyrosine-protein phosphatase [Caenorhabditis elegans]